MVSHSNKRQRGQYASDLLAHHRLVGGQWNAARRSHPSTRYNEEEDSDEEGNEETEKAEFADDKTKEDSREAVLRVDFDFRPFSVSLNDQIAREPSAHERMEAFLELREWLESIGEGARISKLLST